MNECQQQDKSDMDEFITEPSLLYYEETFPGSGSNTEDESRHHSDRPKKDVILVAASVSPFSPPLLQPQTLHTQQHPTHMSDSRPDPLLVPDACQLG
ncbi:unnamed protein product [Schistocephalus solidus]|uniref:Proto-oncogene tyrosine-protein kinase receptor Ret n=1 Tax=Schistocephalus solidus TaxID=70667 RepID=A0A183SC35_SCHSO|nr:unnamed protein product [Schistocephalus solidus]